jgi:hypothetical protein
VEGSSPRNPFFAVLLRFFAALRIDPWQVRARQARDLNAQDDAYMIQTDSSSVAR